jgi:hypothetical protein
MLLGLLPFTVEKVNQGPSKASPYGRGADSLT